MKNKKTNKIVDFFITILSALILTISIGIPACIIAYSWILCVIGTISLQLTVALTILSCAPIVSILVYLARGNE